MVTESKFIIVVITLLTSATVCPGQIITGNFDSYIPCCSGFPITSPYIDSFDTDSDNICEFWIQGLTSADDYGFNAIACEDVQLNEVVQFGQSFPRSKWEWYGSGVPHTVLFEWGDWWLPNTGPKYLGFRRINAVADTTYGWVELDFKEEPSGPFDTLFILDFAYSLTPNIQLTAGQTQITSIGSVLKNDVIEYYPNPVYDRLIIINLHSLNAKAYLTDINGKLLESKSLLRGHIDFFDFSQLSSGIYLLSARTENEMHTYKIIKD